MKKKPLWLTIGSQDAIACAEHFQRGDLPCPWPLCPNGVNGAELTARIFGTTIDRLFMRRSWSALDGTERYGWDEPDSSSWFKVLPVVRAELERLYKEPARPITKIYHYTTPGALLGIISSDDLWLTDFEFMNDSAEIRYGLEVLESALAELGGSGLDARSRELVSGWRLQVKEDNSYRICLACFSQDDDSLSQWRGYGRGANAVAIGFDPQTMFLGAHESVLDGVLYDRVRQKETIEAVINVHLELAKWDDGKKVRTDPFLDSTFDRLLRHVVLFKHSAFADEREVRFVYAENGPLFDREGYGRAPTCFRSANDRIIPYTTLRSISRPTLNGKPLPVFEPGPLPITEIIIGPQETPQLLRSGITRLLADSGREVPVSYSQIPFRPPA